MAALAGPLGALVAGGLFWLLLHGGVRSSVSLRGYAEQIDHPLAPVLAGRVGAVNVRLGQQVKAGELVAAMETRELELARQAAQLELGRARAQLAAQEVLAQASVSRSELQALRLLTIQSRDRAQLAEVNQQVARLEKRGYDAYTLSSLRRYVQVLGEGFSLEVSVRTPEQAGTAEPATASS